MSYKIGERVMEFLWESGKGEEESLNEPLGSGTPKLRGEVCTKME